MGTLSGYALIFGGASGIGRETAYTFAERGAAGMVIGDLNETGAEETAAVCQRVATNPKFQVIPVAMDVRVRESVKTTVSTTLKSFGRIDYCVNSAGIGANCEKTMAEMPTQEFDEAFDTNGRGAFHVLGEVSRVMLTQEEKFVEGRNGRRSVGRGMIVALSSIAATIPVATHAQYCVGKAAAASVTYVAATELARKGVRVNCILPCYIDTPMMERDFKRTPELREAIKTLMPSGRMGKPEEVAEAIHFLCSPGASLIHGHGLVIDAGASLTRGLA